MNNNGCEGCFTYGMRLNDGKDRYHCPVRRKQLESRCHCQDCLLKPMCTDSCIKFLDFLFIFKIISLHE